MRIIPALIAALIAAPAVAETIIPPKGPVTGWPMPRFVSLKSGKANMRTGPSRKHPIAWHYQRKGLPMMIIDEWDHWRKVVDSEGESGWMHKSLLSGNRTALVLGDDVLVLRAEPDMKAAGIMRLAPRVILMLNHCQNKWCHMTVGKRSGWLRADNVFGGE